MAAIICQISHFRLRKHTRNKARVSADPPHLGADPVPQSLELLPEVVRIVVQEGLNISADSRACSCESVVCNCCPDRNVPQLCLELAPNFLANSSLVVACLFIVFCILRQLSPVHVRCMLSRCGDHHFNPHHQCGSARILLRNLKSLAGRWLEGSRPEGSPSFPQISAPGRFSP